MADRQSRAVTEAAGVPRGPWIVLSPFGGGVNDGIGDFADRLTSALGAIHPTQLVVRRASWRELDAIDPARTGGVIVQCYPPAFLRGDFRHLLRWLARVRASGAHVVVTLHEFWPPLNGSFRRAAAQWVFKRVVRALVRASTMAVVTQPLGRVKLADAVRTDRVTVIPIGAAVLPGAESVAKADGIQLVMFGQPAALQGDTLRAVAAWLARTPGASLEWCARSADEMRSAWTEAWQLPADRVRFSGGLPAAELSRRLRAGHIALAPNASGTSTRRSSVSALLAQGLPIVAIDGEETSDALRESGAFMWAADGEPAAFVAALDALAADPARQAALSARASAYFDEHLSWPRLAGAYAALLKTAVTP